MVSDLRKTLHEVRVSSCKEKERLHLCLGLGRACFLQCCHLVMVWRDSFTGEYFAKECHRSLVKLTLLYVKGQSVVPPSLQDMPQSLVMFLLCGTKDQEVTVDADGVRFEAYDFADLLIEYLRCTVHSKVQPLETLESAMCVKRCQLSALFC